MSVRQALGEPRVFFGAPAGDTEAATGRSQADVGGAPNKKHGPQGEPPRAGGPWKGANKACEPEV